MCRVGSRTELSVWLCEAHNRINQLLGKEAFPCNIAALDARWKHGGPHCDYGLEADE